MFSWKHRLPWPHPGNGELLSLALSGSGESSAHRVARHAESCPRCRREIERLRREWKRLVELEAALGPPEAPDLEAMLPSLLAGVAILELGLCLKARSQFSAGDPLRPAWMFLSLAAACRVGGILLSELPAATGPAETAGRAGARGLRLSLPPGPARAGTCTCAPGSGRWHPTGSTARPDTGCRTAGISRPGAWPRPRTRTRDSGCSRRRSVPASSAARRSHPERRPGRPLRWSSA